jgi:hypothetical protein
VLLALAARLDLPSFVLGEWSGVAQRVSPRFRDPVRRFTVELHRAPGGATEGTAWRDDANASGAAPLDAFLLAHFEVAWQTDEAADVFALRPARALLTTARFQAVMGGAAWFAPLRLGRWALDLTLYNQSHFTAVLSARDLAGTAEYAVVRAPLPAAGGRRSYAKWVAIAAAVILAQAAVFVWLRRSSASMGRRLDELRAQVVIDLDDPAPERARRKRKRD